jgi:hypothetical protein
MQSVQTSQFLYYWVYSDVMHALITEVVITVVDEYSIVSSCGALSIRSCLLVDIK